MQPSRVPAALGLALALWAASSGLALFHYPIQQVGDGFEYSLMFVAWSRHASPGITQEDLDAYNSLVAARPIAGAGHVSPQPDPWLQIARSHPTRWDMRHFWFYSLMAGPFRPLAALLNLHPLSAFALLNAALALATILIAQRWTGPRGALAAALVLTASPAFWYINKIHAEVLIAATLLLGFIGAASGRFAWAGLALALGSAQTTLLAPFSILLLAWAWFTDRAKPRATTILTFASLALIVLPPLFYWSRHGFTNPLSHLGYAQPALLGWKRISTLWVDPDRGLLLLWPLALPCLALSFGFVKNITRNFLIAFLALYLALTHLLLPMQVNWNPGGSHLVHRYAIWFIPLAWFPLLRWVGAIEHSSATRRIILVAPLLLLAAWSGFQYRPSQPDTITEFNAVSRWVYSTAPSLYDPDPEVFLERACREELGGYRKPLRRVERWRFRCLGGQANQAGFWAASDPSCRKIYVSREGLDEQSARPLPAPIAGCPASTDPAAILTRARAAAPEGTGDFYFSSR